VRRVLRFLDVDETVPLEVIAANPTVALRSLRLRRMVRAVRQGRGPVSRAVKAAVIGLTTTRLRENVLHPIRHRVLYSSPPAPDAELMLELRRRFKAEVVSLSEFLDRDLVTLWGYDGIG